MEWKKNSFNKFNHKKGKKIEIQPLEIGNSK